MKNTKLFLLAISGLALLVLPVSAQLKTTDWQKKTLPPTGYTPLKPSFTTRKGKILYDKKNCSSCHQINGEGGTMGPMLDGIGGHRGEEFLIDRLQNPLKQSLEFSEIFGGKPSLMPHTGLNKSQARLIARYLLTLSEPAEGYTIRHHEKRTKDESSSEKETDTSKESAGSKLGSQLFLEHGCAACHTTYDEDPRFGPTLKGVGKRKTREEIEDILNGHLKNNLMKDQAKRLDPQEVKCITEFLLKLPAQAGHP
ncbi:MAG: cytochrome c [Cyanobacteria bacterium TGS_CYA1]|nr:cytochrome c [Cyanobacteria bacterium TGS_CYA1]